MYERILHHSMLLVLVKVLVVILSPSQFRKHFTVAMGSVHRQSLSHLNVVGPKEGIELKLVC